MAKMKNVTVRGYNIDDVPAMAEIWNEVVKEGNAFPQKETLDYEGAKNSLLHKHSAELQSMRAKL